MTKLDNSEFFKMADKKMHNTEALKAQIVQQDYPELNQQIQKDQIKELRKSEMQVQQDNSTAKHYD